MPIKQIVSPEAKYLAATDILIGDMSDINYEYLLFDRPIVLLANEWLKNNFPDIGIKTDVDGLENALDRSINCPEEYHNQRNEWLAKTIYKPYENASSRVIDTAISNSGYKRPLLVIIHGDSEVRKTNLFPIYEEAIKRGLKAYFVPKLSKYLKSDETIYFAAHFADLNIRTGYKVHLDHGLKGKGTANVELSKRDYLKNDCFPLIDLHITAGEIGRERTCFLLGSKANRVAMVGYPKVDHLLKVNTQENKKRVLEELGFCGDLPLITYAPAGKCNYEKPGGSLSSDLIEMLDKISIKRGFNILLKYKQAHRSVLVRGLKKIRRLMKI